ncbi:MAG: hypothetical protein Q8K92_08420 [Leadbetterella sp.]|nr:hypothetical protein [Leadbetterella sp.]
MPFVFKSREIVIQGEYVSCITCDLCYDASNSKIPSFCQEFKTEVNPSDILKNHKVARSCEFYCPKGMERWARALPESKISRPEKLIFRKKVEIKKNK